MKHGYTTLFLFLGLSSASVAQEDGTLSWHAAPAFDAAAVAADDQRRAEEGELDLYARRMALVLTSAQHGAWSLENGSPVCRLAVASTGAQALELLLDDVDVPPGASLLLRATNGRALCAPLSLDLPKGVHSCSSPLVFEDSVLVEYREPADAPFTGRFTIDGVAHAYREVDDLLREGSCHVNVACTPESTGWEGPIAATVRISVVTTVGNGWCSGTLVNNVRQDCTPYILTAFHCGRLSTTSQFGQYKFYFHFQYATCQGGAYSTDHFLTGAQKVAYSDDYAPEYQGLGGSDFMLLRMNLDVPASFDPFWAGWDATALSTVTADGVCIHHPTGAPKRISSYTQTLTTGHPMASSGLMTHYKVHWAPTQNGFGVTEEGSSGAGLFKPNATVGPVLIGTLTGSSSGMNCSNNSGTSYFGKMSYHWTNNPNAANIKLKRWLDPDDTGTLVLGGSADPCGAPAGIAEAVQGGKLDLYPNPATDQVVVLSGTDGRTQYQLTDAMGHVLRQGEWTGARGLIDLSGMANGTYLIRTVQHGSVRTVPLMIVR